MLSSNVSCRPDRQAAFITEWTSWTNWSPDHANRSRLEFHTVVLVLVHAPSDTPSALTNRAMSWIISKYHCREVFELAYWWFALTQLNRLNYVHVDDRQDEEMQRENLQRMFWTINLYQNIWYHTVDTSWCVWICHNRTRDTHKYRQIVVAKICLKGLGRVW